jgi:hypothetical protein
MKAGAVWSLALGLLVSKAQSIGSVGQAEGSIDTGPQPFDLNGSNYTYPWPVHVYNFESQFQELQMAFMDVAPAANVTANGQVAVLFHGLVLLPMQYYQCHGPLPFQDLFFFLFSFSDFLAARTSVARHGEKQSSS